MVLFSRPLKWHETSHGAALSENQRDAAQLLSDLEGDFGKVESILGLPAGTVRGWLAKNENFKWVVEMLDDARHPIGEREYDFSNVLKPKQLDAAHLYFEEGLTQVEVARRLQLTDRTIRNWLSDPAFRTYGRQLRRSRDERATEAQAVEESNSREGLADLRRAAIEVVRKALDESDVKAALALLRPLLK